MTQLSAFLAAALASLDPTNDAHWTNDGQARVDVVNVELARLGGETVTRQDIIDGAPLFTRDSAPELIAQYHAVKGPMSPDVLRAQEAEPDETPAAPTTPPPAPPRSVTPAPPGAPPAQQAAPAQPSLPPLGEASRDPKRSQTLAGMQVNPSANKGAPARASEVTREGSALDVPLEKLMQSPELLQSAIDEIASKSEELILSKRRIDQLLAELHTKSELCVHRLEAIRPKANPHDGLRDYLEQAQRAREERGRRARMFIESGTTAKDVARQLRTSSPLDDAMSRRKAAPGSARPAVRGIAAGA